MVLAGFGDDIGGATATRKLSARRAEAVRRELLAILPKHYAANIQAEGFGQVAPVACNDNDLGRRENRRVEVFLTP